MMNAVLPPRAKVRCREIDESDIPAVAALLARGFPGRRPRYWTGGLERLAARPAPEGCPRFGYLIESGGAIVGALVVIASEVEIGNGERAPRCNLSSWYVEPAFRSYASLLSSFALKRKDVTYTNISPAPHTWPILEAQGFKPYCRGQVFALPALVAQGPEARIEEIRGDSQSAAPPTSAPPLLVRHASYGCLSLVCRSGGRDFPFVFAPFRIKAGRVRLPLLRLIYCREIADFVRFAGPLGRFLLRRGVLSIVLDANGAIAGLPGVYREARGRKYYRGPHPPRHGDLADSELVFFGP